MSHQNGYSGAEARIDTPLLDYKRSVEAAGCSNFAQECPKLVIRHIFEPLKPQLLKDLIEDELEKQDPERLRSNKFRYFISEVVRLADVVENTSTWRNQSNERDRKLKGKGQKHKGPSGKTTETLPIARVSLAVRHNTTKVNANPCQSVYILSVARSTTAKIARYAKKMTASSRS